MMNRREIEHVLSTKESIASINTLTKEQLTDLFGESVSRLHGYDQHNPHHHLDLLTHTTAVISNIDETVLSSEDTQALRLAALLHDVGKPDVAKPKDGRYVFYGHPARSAEIADSLLASYGFTEEERRRACFFIAFHDSFIHFRMPDECSLQPTPVLKPITSETVKKQIHMIQCDAALKYGYHPELSDFTLLLHMAAADASAQADIVYLHGKVHDTRQNKLRRIRRIAEVVSEIV